MALDPNRQLRAWVSGLGVSSLQAAVKNLYYGTEKGLILTATQEAEAVPGRGRGAEFRQIRQIPAI